MLAFTRSLQPSLQVDRVYREHFDFVWANLRRFGVPPEFLEDACHDVFVVVQRRASDFDPSRASLRTWLFGIVRRVAADQRRSRERRDRKMSRVRAFAVELPPQSSRAAAETRTLISEFLGSVDDEHASIFILSQLYGVPLREVADSLNLNPNTVASRLRALRKRFKALAAHEYAATEVADEGPSEQTKGRVLAGLCPLLVPPAKPASLFRLETMLVTACVAIGVLAAAMPAPREDEPPIEDEIEVGEVAYGRAGPLEPTIPDVVPAVSPPPKPTRRPAPVRRPQKRESKSRPRAQGDLHEELALVTEARGAVRLGKPNVALRVAREYATRFPRGSLRAEMDVVRVDGLCRLDRADDAAAVAGKPDPCRGTP